MKLRSLLYPFLFPAWEFLLIVLLPPDYYVGASCLQTHPHPICSFHFRPSPAFILLVIAPFIVSILLGLWKKWDEPIAFGIPALAVVLVALLLLYIFEKSWIPFTGAGIASVVLYGGLYRRINCSAKGREKWVWLTVSLIISFILCIMVWSGISGAV